MTVNTISFHLPFIFLYLNSKINVSKHTYIPRKVTPILSKHRCIISIARAWLVLMWRAALIPHSSCVILRAGLMLRYKVSAITHGRKLGSSQQYWEKCPFRCEFIGELRLAGANYKTDDKTEKLYVEMAAYLDGGLRVPKNPVTRLDLTHRIVHLEYRILKCLFNNLSKRY